MNIESVSIEQLKQVISIKEEIAALEQKLVKIIGGEAMPKVAAEAPVKKGRKHPTRQRRRRDRSGRAAGSP